MQVIKSRINSKTIEDIPIDKITPAKINRSSMGDLASLKESIKQYGLINPILVTKKPDRIQLLAGHRRLQACKELGIPAIECIVIEQSDITSELAIALIENLQREDLNAIDEAKLYKNFIDRGGHGSIEKLRQIIGKSRSYVEDVIDLLKLSYDVQSLIIEKKLSKHAAREIMLANMDPKDQLFVARKVIQTGMGGRRVKGFIIKSSIPYHYNKFRVESPDFVEKNIFEFDPKNIPNREKVHISDKLSHKQKVSLIYRETFRVISNSIVTIESLHKSLREIDITESDDYYRPKILMKLRCIFRDTKIRS